MSALNSTLHISESTLSQQPLLMHLWYCKMVTISFWGQPICYSIMIYIKALVNSYFMMKSITVQSCVIMFLKFPSDEWWAKILETCRLGFVSLECFTRLWLFFFDSGSIHFTSQLVCLISCAVLLYWSVSPVDRNIVWRFLSVQHQIVCADMNLASIKASKF